MIAWLSLWSYPAACRSLPDPRRPVFDPSFFPQSPLTPMPVSHHHFCSTSTTSPLEKLCAGFTSWFSVLSLVHEKLLNFCTQVTWSWGSPQLLRVKPRSPRNRKSLAEGANTIDRRAICSSFRNVPLDVCVHRGWIPLLQPTQCIPQQEPCTPARLTTNLHCPGTV